ncbi:hypothetical protein HYH03_008551 [Edaphochlamys debaryana]|uniref:Uncharacterized protein n=1 Tax=Edaphochlamys debaryana TaxID=47281 RepID=A0A835Y0L5_9CHLO|nr:hypothetical protein HYH03_008551 [Edaphochlamys debaryana]|eukprot:KAG2493124.1 hypothetical protein HYH03_008551 [Edaphochlamys debaryana]
MTFTIGHCGAKASLEEVFVSTSEGAEVPLDAWLRRESDALGRDALQRRQLNVFWWNGAASEEAAAAVVAKQGRPTCASNPTAWPGWGQWRAATIRSYDGCSYELKYHDEPKRSSARIWLPFAITHYARCPPISGPAVRPSPLSDLTYEEMAAAQGGAMGPHGPAAAAAGPAGAQDAANAAAALAASRRRSRHRRPVASARRVAGPGASVAAQPSADVAHRDDAIGDDLDLDDDAEADADTLLDLQDVKIETFAPKIKTQVKAEQVSGYNFARSSDFLSSVSVSGGDDYSPAHEGSTPALPAQRSPPASPPRLGAAASLAGAAAILAVDERTGMLYDSPVSSRAASFSIAPVLGGGPAAFGPGPARTGPGLGLGPLLSFARGLRAAAAASPAGSFTAGNSTPAAPGSPAHRTPPPADHLVATSAAAASPFRCSSPTAASAGPVGPVGPAVGSKRPLHPVLEAYATQQAASAAASAAVADSAAAAAGGLADDTDREFEDLYAEVCGGTWGAPLAAGPTAPPAAAAVGPCPMAALLTSRRPAPVATAPWVARPSGLPGGRRTETGTGESLAALLQEWSETDGGAPSPCAAMQPPYNTAQVPYMFGGGGVPGWVLPPPAKVARFTLA